MRFSIVITRRNRFRRAVFTKNITTGIAVAQARGVALLACAKRCSALFEYTPMQIKQAITGYGKADKKQMQEVVTTLLRLQTVPRPDDAADALAAAMCHGFTNRFGSLFTVGNTTRTAGNNTAPTTYFRDARDIRSTKTRAEAALDKAKVRAKKDAEKEREAKIAALYAAAKKR